LGVLHDVPQTCRVVCAQQAYGQTFVPGLFHHQGHGRATQKVNPGLRVQTPQQVTSLEGDRLARCQQQGLHLWRQLLEKSVVDRAHEKYLGTVRGLFCEIKGCEKACYPSGIGQSV
jgi:hypothetical protein